MTTVDQARIYFLALGWREIHDDLSKSKYSLQGPRVDGPNCECNDGPPRPLIRLWSQDFGGEIHESMELILAGKVGGEWFTVKAYSLPLDVSVLNQKIESLTAAWRAIYEGERS